MTQEQTRQLAKQGHNLFITGKAGTGKTYTLLKIIDDLRRQGKRVAITATTGVAATHLSGHTIHSWSGLGIIKEINEQNIYRVINNGNVINRVARCDTLIIDEISMCPDYFFMNLNSILRRITRIRAPFGGLQLIVSGDFFQLPPVDGDYCFTTKSWELAKFKVCYLNKIYRQKDPRLISFLNTLRATTPYDDDLDILDSLKDNVLHESVKLYPKNINVNRENEHRLAKIQSKSIFLDYQFSGDPKYVEILKKSMKYENKPFEVKIGAQVMITMNDSSAKGENDYEYVNGTTGIVEEVNLTNVYVKIRTLKDNRLIYLPKHTKTIVSDDGEHVLASCVHFPLQLAWALTVHKSQGATLNAVTLDLSETFVHNMGYVAFSRTSSLDSIHLIGYNTTSLEVDQEIRDVDQEFIRLSKEHERLCN